MNDIRVFIGGEQVGVCRGFMYLDGVLVCETMDSDEIQDGKQELDYVYSPIVYSDGQEVE